MPSGGTEKLVLLNDFTTSEAVTTVELTESDDGVPYSLKHILIIIGFNQLEKDYGVISYSNNLFTSPLKIGNAIQSSRVGIIRTWEELGKIRNKCSWSASWESHKRQELHYEPFELYYRDFEPITRYTLTFDQSVICTIKVWGVVA
jgi:hypothetical protein